MRSPHADHPRVFISYSHDSPEHLDRVLVLSDRLRVDGIDCHIDQYEESPPEGWPRWMITQIEEAEFVLVVCTENYERRFRGKEEPGRAGGEMGGGDHHARDLRGRSQEYRIHPCALLSPLRR